MHLLEAISDNYQALLALLLGAFLGFVLTGLRSAIERIRVRRSVASILLVELSWLEHNLHKLYEDQAAADSRGTLPTSLYQTYRKDLLTLKAKQARDVAWFYALVDDVQAYRNYGNEVIQRGEVNPLRRHKMIRLYCYLALAKLPAAKKALEAAGGAVFDPPATRQFSDLPPAPERLFPEAPPDTYANF